MIDFQKKLQTLLPGIMASPRLYPHSFDLDKAAVLLIEADQDFYKNTLFLDQSVLRTDTAAAWVPLYVLSRYMDTAANNYMASAHFIFHIGHCGSTLISRLLDELPWILSLREPLLLCTLARELQAIRVRSGDGFEEMFKRVYKLLVRRFSPKQQVVIKPTSMCNNLAGVLLAQNPANRGILLFVTLEVYLASILDKNDSTNIDEFLAHRFASLRKIVPDLDLEPTSLSRPEKIAFSWLTEAAQFYLLSTRGLESRLLLLDFDQFLAQRDTQILNIFHHFSIPGASATLGSLLASPVFRSHSKQPGFAYTSVDREAVLNVSRNANESAINMGIRFAAHMMKTHPDLGELTQKIPLA